MQVRLPGRRVAGIDVADELPLVDVGDLLRQEGRPASLVIDAGRAQDHDRDLAMLRGEQGFRVRLGLRIRSEEHTSELQSLMRISYAVFCLKKKTKKNTPRMKSR